MINVNDNEFEREVLKADGLVVADFWAPWCGPCVRLGPVLERLDKQHNDVKFVKINVEENQTWANKLGVQSIPALFFFKDGKLVDRQVGLLPEPVLRQHLNTLKAA